MRSIPAMTRSELSRFGQSRSTMIILFGIAIIPMLYGGLLIWSNFDPTHRLEHVQAAIVNNDEPVTIEVSGEEQIVPLGRTLTGNLTSSAESNNFDWNLTDADDAASGLADGRYAAVLTIPQNFSAAATSTSGDAAAAQKAMLSFESNDANLFLTGVITDNISASVATTLNSDLTATYLDNVFLGFNPVHESIGAATDGAGTLQDGAGDLADGADAAAAGAGQLVVGLGDLATGSSALSEGAGALYSGSQDFVTGIDALQTGANGLAAGSKELAAGTSDLADGAQELAAGVDTLRSRTAGLPEQIHGAQDTIAQALDRIGGEQGLADGLNRATQGTAELAASTTRFADELGDYTDSVSRIAQECSASGATEEFCAELTGIVAENDSLKSGHDAISSVANAVVSGTAQLSTELASTSDELTGLLDDAQHLFTEAPKLVSGIGDLMDGVDALAAGSSDLDSGAQDLASGVSALRDGTTTAVDGAKTLRDGLATLSGSTQALATGASDAHSGGAALASGTDELADGSNELAAGATTLADSLSEGADQVPTYSEADRDNLADVVSAPVSAEVTRANAVASYGYGLGPYFMALALWVGAMALYMIVRAIPARAIASTVPTWRIAMAGLGTGWILGLIQSVGLVLVLRYVVGLEVANLVGCVLFALLVSMTFMAINQSLIAAFRTKGRFVALVLIVLQLSSAGATYPIETTPAFFQAISNWLPMTHAVNGFRTLTAGGGQGIGVECAWLMAWMLIGFTLTVLAARKQRSWTIARLHPELVI